MDQALNDPWLGALANLVVFGSAATWIYIASRLVRYGEVLPWEPRRPVPWGPPAAILAVAFALMAISSAWAPGAEVDVARERPAPQIAINILSLLALQLLMAGGFFAAVAVIYGVTIRDVGLPRSVSEALRDLAIGVTTCFAALLPVRIVQGLLLWLMGRHDDISKHPLIETLTSGAGANFGIMLLACLSAVIVAPICEELTFRLLLQGWLEKLVTREPDCFETPITSADDGETMDGPPKMQVDETRTADRTLEAPNSSFVIRHSSFPHAWLPIFISSFLFGIAHFGYGPEPVPLFFFAVFLGYVYQRTHRILPCIVAHGLFNLVSMLALWRIIVITPEHGG
jgi:membrane protease YdiL (CAAX protease family)